MKILILTTYFSKIMDDDPEFNKESTYRLYRKLQDNHDVDIALFSQLELTFKYNFAAITFNGNLLENYDFLIFRAIRYRGINNEELAEVVSQYAHNKNIKSINGLHFAFFGGNFNKLRQAELFSANNLNIPSTYYNVAEVEYPTIIKTIHGSHGRGVHLVNNNQQLPFFRNEYIFQNKLPNAQDYRVLVLGGKVVGGILRQAQNGSHLSNVSAGGKPSNFEVNDQLNDISLKVAKICKLDFCGVDIMQNEEGDYLLLEVNRNPEFNGFEIATKIDVPAAIEEYLVFNS